MKNYWAWFFVLIATYPWLLGADLASDSISVTALICFITGACLIAPSQRLPRWQTVLFGACAGFLFEARRPIPDGTLALTLIGAGIFLSTNRHLTHSKIRSLWMATLINCIACLAWLIGAAHFITKPNFDNFEHSIFQLFFSIFTGAVVYLPVSRTQNAVMDRLGIPPVAKLT